ncbi:hypothetical protein HID58_005689 [Brassica napus]|uniref:Uncharacterized protein n=1 Tax=Brassica napus TaxID=3708 RepID=A0ABQ8EBQ2_BRANA|nr:hypothetical protein HID58_005689 [Brassica napus]
MLLDPDPATDPPPDDAPPPPPSLQRRIPAVAAADPRGVARPGLAVEEAVEVDCWDWEKPLAIVVLFRKVERER